MSIIDELRNHKPRECYGCGEYGCDLVTSGCKSNGFPALDATPEYLERYGCACTCHDTALFLRAADVIERLSDDAPEWGRGKRLA